DRAVFTNPLVEDFSVAVKPADASPLSRIEAKFDTLAIGGKLRLDPLRQIFKSLPRGCRNQYRAFGQRAPFGDVCETFAGGRVEPVDFIPHLDQCRPVAGILASPYAELVQDILDVVQLRFGVPMRNIANMEDHVGLDDFFQG